ncbi:unnamed protein product [Protopolystoma xenopodis]|uniref:Uncharacterized protein n=1 Tax=Protopolystoma xenopodis TaxID=117903 RepID=A0A3S5AZN3_9PLAT|nr:unnamed protein product [Protopolystoma xenopodis]
MQLASFGKRQRRSKRSSTWASSQASDSLRSIGPIKRSILFSRPKANTLLKPEITAPLVIHDLSLAIPVSSFTSSITSCEEALDESTFLSASAKSTGQESAPVDCDLPLNASSVDFPSNFLSGMQTPLLISPDSTTMIAESEGSLSASGLISGLPFETQQLINKSAPTIQLYGNLSVQACPSSAPVIIDADSSTLTRLS